MPSQLHESLIELFRNRPEMAYILLRDAFTAQVPVPAQIQASEATMSEIRPPEYDADLVLVGASGPAVIVEVQLQPDEEKVWTWPQYITGLRARLRRDVYLLVVTPSAATARWAKTTLRTGHPRFDLEPLVLGPQSVPAITDPAQVVVPEIAVLSAIAHGTSRSVKRAVAVGHCALVAVSGLDDARARFYADLILSELSQAARAALEKMVMDKNYEYQSEFARRYFGQGLEKGREEGREEGEQQGLAHALLAVLAARSVAVSAAARQRIEGCPDREQLQRWLVRAATATALDEVWADG